MGLEASRDQAPQEKYTSERNKQEHRGKKTHNVSSVEGERGGIKGCYMDENGLPEA